MRRVMVVLALAGCNQVFDLAATTPAPQVDAAQIDVDLRPDLDGDKVPDIDDDCISSAADQAVELDGDGLVGPADPCPFDMANGTDADGDTVPNICDPFPAAGDHHRCTMQFHDAALNATLWHERTGNDPWIRNGNSLTVGPSAGTTLLATEAIEAPTVTTYDVYGTLQGTSGTTRLQLWFRTNDQAAGSDVGCELGGDATSTHISVLNTAATGMVTAGAFSIFRLRATIEPTASGTNVRCAAVLYWFGGPTTVPTVATHVAIAPGGFGLTAIGGGVSIAGLAIYDRADAPAL